MFPSVSIIVPAKNEEKVVDNCIKSILNLNYPKEKMEVIVSIDGSKDKTLEICKKYKSKIKIIVSKPKRCKAEALNAVLPKAKGDIIAFYDADCIVDRNCLREAAKHFSKKDIAGVSGLLKSYNRNENTLTRILSMETCLASTLEHLISRCGSNAHFSGKNMYIRKEVLREVGLFDTHSFLEDVELSIRMKRNGYKVVFEPNSVIWHEEPSSMDSFFKQRTRWVRGNFRIRQTRSTVGDRLSDVIHAIPYYLSPFSLLTGTALAFCASLRMPLMITLPFLMLFSFDIGLIVYSRIRFKEPLRHMLLLPIWFVLSNFYPLLAAKAYIEEKTNKEFSWSKIKRSGYGSMEQILGSY
jgi:cellulose synthase/poly-beta-1,6-N-acetylglucosamine synthase-like glycosyltransferase